MDYKVIMLGLQYNCQLLAHNYYPSHLWHNQTRVPCVYLENQEVANLDLNDPISVSYSENFPGEPTGKDNPELLTKLRPSLNHGHDQSIINGISRIGYMKEGIARRINSIIYAMTGASTIMWLIKTT